MLVYFRKYTIFVWLIAIALPVIASTVWPLFTGQIMAASLGGLAGEFVLFIAGLFIGYAIFERRAQATVDGYVAKYNEACDPEALIREGAHLAEAITFPCNQTGAWFMGYYAQALLDVGQVDKAKTIAEGLRMSIERGKTPVIKAGILVNLLPLSEKLDGTEASLALLKEGLSYCDEDGTRAVAQLREFLASQQKVLDARASGDQKTIAALSEAIRSNARYPYRIRVEYAWDEASAEYRLGDVAEERRCLQFVIDHGNKLALVAKAKERLSSLSV